jgi:hypothetical protein
MDMVDNRGLLDYKRVLAPGGRYVPCSGVDWQGGGKRVGSAAVGRLGRFVKMCGLRTGVEY